MRAQRNTCVRRWGSARGRGEGMVQQRCATHAWPSHAAHLRDAADVLLTVSRSKAQVLVQAVAHIVAVQQAGGCRHGRQGTGRVVVRGAAAGGGSGPPYWGSTARQAAGCAQRGPIVHTGCFECFDAYSPWLGIAGASPARGNRRICCNRKDPRVQVWRSPLPMSFSACSRVHATVLFPEPLRPVNQRTQPFWPNIFSLSSVCTMPSCHLMLVEEPTSYAVKFVAD